MVAHEVRTPLSVMRSSAQMLADPGAGQPPTTPSSSRRSSPRSIASSASSTGLIELARPLEQRLEPTPLARPACRARRDFVAAQAAEAGHRDPVRPRHRRAARALRPRADLSGGAQPAGQRPAGAAAGRTASGCARFPEDSGTVGFEVGDDGPGLPRDIRDRIFQPFVTGREGGTGSGWRSSSGSSRPTAGSVSVRSEPGRGTIFEVQTAGGDRCRGMNPSPRRRRRPADAAHAADPDRAHGTRVGRGGERERGARAAQRDALRSRADRPARCPRRAASTCWKRSAPSTRSCRSS